MSAATDPFLRLIRGVCGLHGLSAAVVDAAGRVELSAGPEMAPCPAFFARVQRDGDVRFERDATGNWFCGAPLDGSGEDRRVLVLGGAPGAEAPQAEGLRELCLGLKASADARVELQAEAEKLTEELDRIFEELHLLSRVANEIKSLFFSREMLEGLARELVDIMRADYTFCHLPGRAEFDVDVCAAGARGAQFAQPRAFRDALIAHGPAVSSRFEEDAFLVADSGAVPGLAPLLPVPFRCLLVRIRQKGREYGWLGLVSSNMGEVFRRGEYRLVNSMAEQLGLVIANTDLYRDLESFVVSVVKSLVQAIEAKDSYTRGHSERVCQYALTLGDSLGLSAKDRETLRWAALLHDIGKIGMPESILHKTGRLDDDEMAVIRAHPVEGVRILEPVVQLRAALPAIRHHHERYDGKGYPDGLAGEAIPLLARVIGVADAYDAITSSRAYRAERTSAQALEIVENCLGTQFDPGIGAAFVACIREGSLPGDV